MKEILIFIQSKLKKLFQNMKKKLKHHFFKLVKEYVKIEKNQFNCPRHHGGVFFEKHPAGKDFINFYGKNYI